MRPKVRQQPLWAIVLAGGEGQRMQPFIQQWLGRQKPKQFCTFVGTRSLFQHTLDRVTHLVAPEQILTVIAREHQAEAQPQLEKRPGVFILEPAKRGTAAGVFLPLTHILRYDPSATVVIFPSDHFVYSEDRFIEIVQRAVWTAEWLTDP